MSLTSKRLKHATHIRTYKHKITAQKMKFSIKDFFSKCEQIRSFLRIQSHLLKNSLMKNFISCAVKTETQALIHYLLSFCIPRLNTVRKFRIFSKKATKVKNTEELQSGIKRHLTEGFVVKHVMLCAVRYHLYSLKNV